MEVVATEIPEIKMIRPKKHRDDRGFLSETWSQKKFAAVGLDDEYVQDNHTFSARRGTVRALHFQIPPFAQAKLVRCTRGAIFDVAVDIRRGSPTFGRHVSALMTAGDWCEVLIPVGFAHGYCTLEPETEVLYKVSDYYAPHHERGLLWDDPALGIDWPVDPAAAILSERDRGHPPLAELKDLFEYEGAGA